MTGNKDWHGLGFDPARGDTASVGALAKQMTDTGNWLKESHEALNRVKNQKDTWTGDASKAFGEALGDLPTLLDDAHRSLVDAGKALRGWQDTLAGHQRKAVELENQARQALAESQRADAAAQQASANANTSITYDAADPAAAQAAQQRMQSLTDAASQANQAAETAHERLAEIRRQAQDLMDRWEDDAGTVEDALDNATDIAPGLLDAIGDMFEDLGEWVVDNLGNIGDIMGMISAIAGALAFIPGVNIIAGPVALAAGALALGFHAADMAVKGDFSVNAWIGLGTDVLGVLPVVGPAAKGLGAATDALHMADGLGTAVMHGGKVFADDLGKIATDAPQAAAVSQWIGGKVSGLVGGNADAIAVATQNTFNLGVQVPGAVDMAVGSDATGDAKDVAGGVAGVGTAGQVPGATADGIGTGFKSLAGSLSDFAKAVG